MDTNSSGNRKQYLYKSIILDFSGFGFRSATAPDPFSHASLQPAADFILSQISIQPVIGIICGSGLGEYSSLLIILTILPLPGELASLVSDPVTLPYSSIPGFPVSTAPGHSGKLVFGSLSENVAELKIFSMLGVHCVGKTVSCWYEMSNHLS